MGLLSRITSVLSASIDEPERSQNEAFERFRNGVSKMGGVIEAEFPCDELPGATGPFGRCPTNPIPVNGIEGEIRYLNTLRSWTGSTFFYHRLRSLESPPSRHPVDHYELVASDSSEWLDLFFSYYYPRRSRMVPEGYTRTAWSRLDKAWRIFTRLPIQGHNQPVDDFPLGLPRVLEGNAGLMGLGPDVARGIALGVQRVLNEHPGRWRRPRATT